MRIVMDVREAQLSRVGVAVYCGNLLKKFSYYSSEIEFIFIASEEMDDLVIDVNGLDVRYIAPSINSPLKSKLKWYWNLPVKLSEFGADLYFGPLMFFPFRKFRCKTVFTLHDAASITTPELVGSKLSWIKNLFFTKNWVRKVDGIVCISNYCQLEFSEALSIDISRKSRIIYHGVPEEMVKSGGGVLHRPVEGRYLVTVGTVYSKKNFRRLIEAFSMLEDTNISLVICGARGADADTIYSAPEEYGVDGRVIFAGRVSNDDLIRYLSYADAFVFPSLYEGFGIPILEAFSRDLPLISSNSTCLPEIAGDAAIYFDPENTKDMAEKIEMVLKSTTLAEELVIKGRARLKDFSWEKSAKEHIEYFKEICQGE